MDEARGLPVWLLRLLLHFAYAILLIEPPLEPQLTFIPLAPNCCHRWRCTRA